MLRSMTGFVQGRFVNKDITIFLTLKSYNSKNLNIYVKINIPHIEIEKKVIKHIREHIQRGRVECFMNISLLKNNQIEIILNRPLLIRIIEELKGLTKDFNPFFVNLTEIPGSFSINPSFLHQETINFIEKSLIKALKKLVKEREREGREIEKEIKRMLRAVEKFTEKIERRKSYQILKIKKIIKRNMKMIGGIKKNEGLKEEELFTILRKADISEELLRIKTHMDEIKRTILKKLF